VSCQSDFSPVVSNSAGEAFVLAASDAAAFAAGGSQAECGCPGACAKSALQSAKNKIGRNIIHRC
jgi:hypothetical protein